MMKAALIFLLGVALVALGIVIPGAAGWVLVVIGGILGGRGAAKMFIESEL